jgi:hypothetical protein
VDTIPGSATNQVYSNAAGNQLSITLNAALANFSISTLTNGKFYILYHVFGGVRQGMEKSTPFGSGYLNNNLDLAPRVLKWSAWGSFSEGSIFT